MTTTQKENPSVGGHGAGSRDLHENDAIVATDRQAFAMLKWQARTVQQTLIKTPQRLSTVTLG
jgi:hypothetical protein